MRTGPEALAIIFICVLAALAMGYMWGYDSGMSDHRCYITDSE